MIRSSRLSSDTLVRSDMRTAAPGNSISARALSAVHKRSPMVSGRLIRASIHESSPAGAKLTGPCANARRPACAGGSAHAAPDIAMSHAAAAPISMATSLRLETTDIFIIESSLWVWMRIAIKCTASDPPASFVPSVTTTFGAACALTLQWTVTNGRPPSTAKFRAVARPCGRACKFCTSCQRQRDVVTRRPPAVTIAVNKSGAGPVAPIPNSFARPS